MSPKYPDRVSLERHHTEANLQNAFESATVEALGYKQNYRRVLHTIGQVCLVVALTAPLSAQFIVAFYQITYGGYFGLIWGWLIPSIMFLPQVLAFAELCSAMPVNGSTYWWIAALAPPKWSRPLSFIAGSTIVFSLFTMICSFSFAISSALCRAIKLVIPNWTASSGLQMGLAMAVVVLWAGMAQIRLDRISVIFVACSAILLLQILGWIVGLPIAHALRNLPFASRADVFGSYENFSDWPPVVAVPFTFFAAAWVNGSWTAPSYLVEGTRNARRAVPKAIIMSYSVTAVIGIAICIVAAFCVNDIVAAGTNPTGFPLFTVLAHHWTPSGAFGFLLAGLVPSMFGGSGAVLANSFQLAAFARDGGLPFSRQLSYVHPRTNTPIWSSLVLCTGSLLILLLGLSPVASQTIFSLATMVNLITTSIPIGLRVIVPVHRYTAGPFSLGRWSKPTFTLAFTFIWYVIIMETFPTTKNWTSSTFNYNWVVTGAVVLLAVVLYAVQGHQYKGPNMEVLAKFRQANETPDAARIEIVNIAHNE